MSNTFPPLIIIIGPTASGKTGLAIETALRVGGEVVSADSRQIYTHCDIGTEKVTKKEMRGVPHHCIDIASPRRRFSVTQWRARAEKALQGIYRRGNTPILAGGTGMYIDALVYGVEYPDVPPNTALRNTLEMQSPHALYAQLQALDPARAVTIEKENPRRLVRAIEIATALGRVPEIDTTSPRFSVTWLHTDVPFTELETRIKERIDRALKKGLVTETRFLKETLGLSWKRLDELGMEYRIVGQYLRGEFGKEVLAETLTRAVRAYAKRQLRWMRKYPRAK
jgi:tRNA dimethylallyltransferase